MISNKTLNAIEYDKILTAVASKCVLKESKKLILNEKPATDYEEVKYLLDKTYEAYKILYTHGVTVIEFFDEMLDETERAKRGGTLSMGEILKVCRLLRSSRIAVTTLNSLSDNELSILKNITNCIYYDKYLENEITSKIITDEQIADNATEKLYQIRQNIKRLNEKIRERLSSYMRQGANKYLQDNVVSMRNGRYVVPVKMEHKNEVKGFIHDRSATGNTVFIEPTEILELNNDLRAETINEKLEIERILQEISSKIGLIADKLDENVIYLVDIDKAFAKATYSRSKKCEYPILNSNGKIKIKGGRHPLISDDKVVPVSIELGDGYNFVLVTGPNTGGKTVTLKLTGLCVAMASSGIFIPAKEGSEISTFNSIFVDIGDEQSIEQSLSTFSSHLKTIIEITEKVDGNSLVLIDEIGAGTDPEEGSALAEAILDKLISANAKGVVTTHYTSLKEYAFKTDKIINASMDFDDNTFAPLYKLKIGMPGTSNAIEIAKRLGLEGIIVDKAKTLLSREKVEFDKVLKEAERIRKTAEAEREELVLVLQKQKDIYAELTQEREKLEREKEKFMVKAKAESRKLVNDKLETAEELLSEMKEIFNKDVYNDSDLVKMATLKNKIENEKYSLFENESKVTPYKNADINTLKQGDKVYIKSQNLEGVVAEVKTGKKQVWVYVGNIRINAKIDDIMLISTNNSKIEKPTVSIKRSNDLNQVVKTEINLIGLNVDEALIEVESFLDKAITSNLSEVRIVHGKGLRILAKAIHNYLKTVKFIDSFRFGKYGEGEDGVTIVKLK